MNVCPYCGEESVHGTNGFFCGSMYGSSREFYRTANCHRMEGKPRRLIEIIKQLESERDALIQNRDEWRNLAKMLAQLQFDEFHAGGEAMIDQERAVRELYERLRKVER